jgi:NADH dehydrogenase
MTVLLIGGTGLLGGAIAEELIARGERVRALVRSGKRVARLRQLGAEFEVGDLRDQRALRRALRGVQAVITTAQGNPLSRKLPMRQIDGQATQQLIVLARQLNVPRFVFISALKADEGAPTVPQLAYKLAAERMLQTSGMEYTIIRPSSFQETFADAFAPFKRLIETAGIGMTIGSGRGRHSFVAIRDVARATVLALHAPEARNQIVPVGGPEDLSYREAYRRIASITGRRVTRLPIPRPLMTLAGALAFPALPELAGFFALFAFFDRAGYTCTTPEWLVRTLGQRQAFDDTMRAIYLPGASGERQPAPDTSGR